MSPNTCETLWPAGGAGDTAVATAGDRQAVARRSPGRPGLLPRTGHRVHRGAQPGRVGMGIHLRGGHRGVSEQVGDHVDAAAGIGDVDSAAQFRDTPSCRSTEFTTLA